jgi:hypothetical protein
VDSKKGLKNIALLAYFFKREIRGLTKNIKGV